MTRLRRFSPIAALFAAAIALSSTPPAVAQGQPASAPDAAGPDRVAIGKRMYMEGILPSGAPMAGTYAGDVRITGQQVICGTCHRRSGLGSGEGREVVPAVAGDMLYKPMRLPTRGLPLAPEQRPAYTDATLKRAIREGIGANGKPLSLLMPRYPLADADLDYLVGYLKALSSRPSLGVSDTEIHFATIITDAMDPEQRKAVLDVYAAYVDQKNAETRHESGRAAHGPWHKEWKNASYRKWVVHAWTLEGPPASWAGQLEALYRKQPVFALVGGVARAGWEPVHQFCERNRLPCVFPTTDVPVIDEQSFYNVYLSQGMALEADAIAQHLADGAALSRPVVQVHRADDARGRAAAAELRRQIERRGGQVTDVVATDAAALAGDFWPSMLARSAGAPLVVWVGESDTAGLWQAAAGGLPGPVYLSTTLHGVTPGQIPLPARERVYLVHPYELPSRLPGLLARSTGWLKQKGVYSPAALQEQGNAAFALRMVGSALARMRGFLVRDHLLENIEHMVDRALYTSVYPRMSLAPGQRFVSRGAYIAQFRRDGAGELVAVTDWFVPAGSATPQAGKGPASGAGQARAPEGELANPGDRK